MHCKMSDVITRTNYLFTNMFNIGLPSVLTDRSLSGSIWNDFSLISSPMSFAGFVIDCEDGPGAAKVAENEKNLKCFSLWNSRESKF